MPELDKGLLFSQLEAEYRRLLDVALKQRQAAESSADNLELSRRLTDFDKEWSHTQQRIADLMPDIRQACTKEELSEWVQRKIEPLAKRINELNLGVQDTIQKRLSAAGKHIRAAREHRHAANAYYQNENDGHTAIFFDEKK